jgi:hypothetical protein
LTEHYELIADTGFLGMDEGKKPPKPEPEPTSEPEDEEDDDGSV